MAYAFLRILVQTRAKGHSAIGVVCYRLGLAAQSSFPGEDGVPRTFDYTHRTGIARTGYALPAGASDAWRDPLEWAHRVEAVDKRKNSRQCRDDVIGLPTALVDAGTHVAATQEYAERLAAEHGTPVHFAVHQPDRGGKNWHAHIVYAGRRLDPKDGDRFAAKRDRTQDLADRKDMDGNVVESRGIHHRHRALWTEVCRGHGLALDWTPSETPQIHIGPQACALERRQIVEEASERMGRAIADSGEASPDPQTLRECAELAHGINDGLTVREMLDLDRDPVHPRAIMSPKSSPTASQRIGQTPPLPQVAPALGLDALPGIEYVPALRLRPPTAPRVRPDPCLPPMRIEHAPALRLEPPAAAPRVRPDPCLPPPHVELAPALRLEPSAAPRVRPDPCLPVPRIEPAPALRLEPSAAPRVRPDPCLPVPRIEPAPTLRLEPPAAPGVRPDPCLPPPHVEHAPATRLEPPAPPFRHSFPLPLPIHLRPEVRELPQRIREVVRTNLERAGARHIKSRMGHAAATGGFRLTDFSVHCGQDTARAANRALDEEVSAFVPRGEDRQTMSAHWEDWHRKLAKAVERWKAHVRRRRDAIVERITAAVLPTARAEAIDRLWKREEEPRSPRPMQTRPKSVPIPSLRPQRHPQVAPQRSPPASGRWDPWD